MSLPAHLDGIVIIAAAAFSLSHAELAQTHCEPREEEEDEASC